MAEKIDIVRQQRVLGLPAAVFLVLPLLLLAGIIVLFLTTGGGLRLKSPVPVEDLSVERTILKPGSIDLYLRNAGPGDLTVAQVIINDAIWPASVSPGRTIPRLGQARLHLDYHWVQGEAYAIRILTGSALAFDVEVPVAFATPQADGRTLAGFTLIGLYVGILPVYLGLLWFPALRRLGRRWMVFLLAITAGLLVFLGLDTLAEGLDQVAGVPGPFQGVGLFGIGAVGTFLLLVAIGRRQAAPGRSGASRRLGIATLIAVGIGLHNLGEGLAIGTAYNLGEVSLGAFLVVGFIVQNITEGLGIIAPILRDRPGVRQLALLGLIGGAPAIAGAWIGGLAPSPVLAVLFFGIGTGAIFEVVYEIGGMIRKDMVEQPLQFTVLAGVMAGMLLLWGTGLLIK